MKTTAIIFLSVWGVFAVGCLIALAMAIQRHLKDRRQRKDHARVMKAEQEAHLARRDDFIAKAKEREICFADPERSKEAAKKVLQRCDVAFRLLAEYERKERARERCLANSTRPRHSRSTLRKTR